MLPCLLAAPTLVRLGGIPYLARPLTLGGFATLLRAGADALGMDGDAGDLPAFADDAFQAWLGGDGLPLLLWESLRRDQPVTLADCARLAPTPGEADALMGAVLRRARMAVPPEGRGRDVGKSEWGPIIYRRYEEGLMPAEFAGLTLDQAFLLATAGKGFDVPDATRDDLQRRWLEESPKWRAEAEAGRARTVDDDLAAMGLERVPEVTPDGG